MRDPTREEMLGTLQHQFDAEFEPDEFEIAIYWFAMYWHGGQSSNLYSVLSTSPYNPGPMGRLEGEGETVQMMFEALEAEYSEAKTKDELISLTPPNVVRGPDDHDHDGSSK
jgi:hypothetical protein